MSAGWGVGSVVRMAQAGETGDALEAARRRLAARDADLADADRVLAATLADAHGIAVDAIGRIDAIASDIDSAATDQPRDTAGAAREVSRNLTAKNRELTAVVREARDAIHAKTVVLQSLSDRYQSRESG